MQKFPVKTVLKSKGTLWIVRQHEPCRWKRNCKFKDFKSLPYCGESLIEIQRLFGDGEKCWYCPFDLSNSFEIMAWSMQIPENRKISVEETWL